MNPEEKNLDGSITTPLSSDNSTAPLEQSLSPNLEQPQTSSAEPASESKPEESAPSLEQVAADLASAAMTDSLESPSQPESPESPEPAPAPDASSEAPSLDTPTLEAPSEPEAPVSLEPLSSPDTPTAPESPTALESPAAAPESPAVGDSTLDLPTPPNDFTNDGLPQDDKSQDDSDSTSEDGSSSSDQKEDDIALRPADPVPGSIGSAFAYSETAPDHSIPVPKPKKLPKSKKNKEPVVDSSDPTATAPSGKSTSKVRIILAVIVGLLLIAVIGVIVFFIASGSSNTTTTKKVETSANTSTTPSVSSLTCTKEGVKNFQQYGNITSGAEQAIAMYSDDTLTSFGTMLTLKYASEDAAADGLALAKELYNTKLENANLSADPFDSSFDSSGTSVVITHQAEGESITAKTARIFDLTVASGEAVTDIDTISNNYESDGFTCEEK